MTRQNQGMNKQHQQPVRFPTTPIGVLSQTPLPTVKRQSLCAVLAICCMIIATGCQSSARTNRTVVQRDPVIPLNISRADLVDHLNRQNADLNAWRCMSTKLHAKLPGVPDQRLSGYIACQSPQYFRLTADNLIVKADLGSNADHCWVYLKPGRSEVLKWKHEDTAMLQQTQFGVPSIDPNWLMLVLGITPLDANNYELSSDPSGKPELYLTADHQCADGRSLRRVIKIDALQGVIRQHAVYDGRGNTLVSAELNRHQRNNGHLIPSHVKLCFPQTDTELSLSFNGIEANPHLPDHYWHMPDKHVKVVDIGDLVRHQTMAHNPAAQHFSGRAPAPRVTLQPPVFHQSNEQNRSAFAEPSQRMLDGTAISETPAEVEEPDWDTPISFSKSAAQPASFETPPAKKKRWWQF